MRTCILLETVQPWSSRLRFKSPQRFHDNCILFVLWLVCAEGLNVMIILKPQWLLSSSTHWQIMPVIMPVTSRVPKRSMDWLDPTLSSLFRSAWVYMCVCVHVCINDKLAKRLVVSSCTWASQVLSCVSWVFGEKVLDEDKASLLFLMLSLMLFLSIWDTTHVEVHLTVKVSRQSEISRLCMKLIGSLRRPGFGLNYSGSDSVWHSLVVASF